MLYILFALSFSQLNGQDLIFSQYYNSPIHFNPAFAGTVNYPHFTTNYRIQWPSISNAYETYSVTYDQFFKRFNSGIGFIALNDDQGDGTLRTTKFAGIYSYKIQFNKDWQIKFGLEASFNQNRINWDKLIFFDQIDPINGPFDGAGVPFPTSEIRPESDNNNYLDIGIGMLLYNPNWYVGLSLDHINGPYVGFTTSPDDPTSLSLPLLFSVHGGFQIDLDSRNKAGHGSFISPNMIFARVSEFNQLNIGAYVQVNQIFGGAWVRHTLKNIDAYIISFGVNLEYIKIGYSFDLTSSELGLSTGGSHEVGISVGLENLVKKESKYNDCLSLFR